MNLSHVDADIYIDDSPIAGRGVFAGRTFQPGEVIEKCQVLRVPADELVHLDQTIVYEYYFAWDGDGAIALGNGSLYNHSDTPNCQYAKDFAQGWITFRATQRIEPGEEISVDYGKPGSHQELPGL